MVQRAKIKASASWATVVVSAIAVLAMCIFIFYMSARPADESDALSLGVVWHIVGFIVPGYDQMSAADQIYWQQMLNHPVRKTAHFLEYAALGALVLNLLVQIKRRQLATEVPALEGSALERSASGERVLEAFASEGPASEAPASEGLAPESSVLEGRVSEGPALIGLARIADLGPHIKRLCASAWAFATIYAATDEIHQLFVSGRTGKPTDVLIDSAGVLFGIFIVAIVLHFIAKHQSRTD